MELKEYQARVISEVRQFLNALDKERNDGNLKHAASDAWDAVKNARYRERKTGSGVDLPTICIKVPTGGGKTLLATQILGEAYKTILTAKNGAGLVLWVVPSDQIYKDTLKALQNRDHFYRQSLETALSRRIEVWEKHEIMRLTPGQLASNLNILLIKLQGANRIDKESLKFFRDSGGNIVQHFPAEDDYDGHLALKSRISNLEMIGADHNVYAPLVRTSIANLVRLCEPIVILDEGQKATSHLARTTLEGFNPTLVVELSATPPTDANIVSRVTGDELLREQMIKLPMKVANSRDSNWQNILTRVKQKREEIYQKALLHYEQGNRLIRPIVLVQVERTGNDQIDAQYIHSEHVKEYLIGHLNIPAASIAIKSSEKDDIEGIDLLSDECPINWIITKQALQEGWDCPFAYILVSLSNSTARQSLTQLVGRVLRQPFVEKTDFSELNESFVYCLRQSTETVIHEIRNALSKEGYEGSTSSIVDISNEADNIPSTVNAIMKSEFSQHYRTPFEGKIYLPRFCVEINGKRSELDYFKHLLSHVKIRDFDYTNAHTWNFDDELRRSTEQFYRVSLNEEALEPLDIEEVADDSVFDDADVKSWLVANIGMDWYSAKQLRLIVENVIAQLSVETGKLSRIRFALLERIKDFIDTQTYLQTEMIFKQLFDTGALQFYLHCVECRFEIPSTIIRKRTDYPLLRRDGSLLQKSLFDYEPSDLNDFEKSIALYFDQHPEVLWWYRNAVGEGNFEIRGYRRQAIYPDYIVQNGSDQRPGAKVYVVESKGWHLSGNDDTGYKRDIANYFDKIGKSVTWQELGEGFDNHIFRFQILDQGDNRDQGWKDTLEKMLTA